MHDIVLFSILRALADCPQSAVDQSGDALRDSFDAYRQRLCPKRIDSIGHAQFDLFEEEYVAGVDEGWVAL
ncbi:MAG: hypothetical protein KKG33_12700 [candidate division Zixibacteria bacterium]|nr:hypothetical protein [candidate division Zixibacteria bacterium]